jgi:hypothetical protein
MDLSHVRDEVNVTMLAADAYGPVDFYQLTLKPSSHDP